MYPMHVCACASSHVYGMCMACVQVEALTTSATATRRERDELFSSLTQLQVIACFITLIAC